MPNLRPRITSVIAWIVAAKKWQQYLCLWLIGAFATLSLPPLYLFPCIFIAIAALYLLLAQSRSWKQAAALGFFFHLGYYMVGLYWINFALLIDLNFAWMIPLCAVGLPAVLSLYGVLLAVVSNKIAKRFAYGTIPHAALFTVSFLVIEWIRGHALTGFPWNLVGYSLGFSDYLLQTASIVGVYGIGAILVLCSVSLSLWVLGHRRLLYVSCLIILAMTAFGANRLADSTNEIVPGIYLRLVQANIPQKLKWDHQAVQQNFSKYLNLSSLSSTRPITHIIWAETAVPFPLDRNPDAAADIAKLIPQNGAVILGTPRVEYTDVRAAQTDAPDIKHIYNSIVGVDHNADILFAYDKSHLVPFGEYVPLPNWLGIKKLVPGIFDYTPGPGPQTFTVGGLPPFSASICYEAIFPGAVEDRMGRAQWLLNLTNDGWYGNSAGPYQHLAHARMRAVEEGLPLIRVAGTGISAVIDPWGRILQQLSLGEGGVIDTELPQALPTPTIYRLANKIMAGF